jgi:hypothetical protein
MKTDDTVQPLDSETRRGTPTIEAQQTALAVKLVIIRLAEL